jgi:hypothetical protein
VGFNTLPSAFLKRNVGLVVPLTNRDTFEPAPFPLCNISNLRALPSMSVDINFASKVVSGSSFKNKISPLSNPLPPSIILIDCKLSTEVP